MGAAKILALAGATALLSTAAIAADFPPPMPPAMVQAPRSIRAAGICAATSASEQSELQWLSHPTIRHRSAVHGWHRQGWIRQRAIFRRRRRLHLEQLAALRRHRRIAWQGRSFQALGSYNNAGGLQSDDYTAARPSGLASLNAYIDLGTWWCITPLSAPASAPPISRIEHFRDTNVIAGGGGWADSGNKINLAWALHAGVAYNVTATSRSTCLPLSQYGQRPDRVLAGEPRIATVVSGNPLAPTTRSTTSNRTTSSSACAGCSSRSRSISRRSSARANR